MPAHNEMVSEKQVIHAVIGERLVVFIRFILIIVDMPHSLRAESPSAVGAISARRVPHSDETVEKLVLLGFSDSG